MLAKNLLPSSFLTGSTFFASASRASCNCYSGKEIHTESRYVSLSFIFLINFEFCDRLECPIHFFIIHSRVTSPQSLGHLWCNGIVWACLKHETAKCETAKWQYISVFQKGKRNICLKCPKFAKTEFLNPIKACTKTFHSPTS